MNLAATIARMKQAGMTAEAIVTALECIVEGNPQPAASLDEIRARVDAENKRRWVQQFKEGIRSVSNSD